MTNGVIQQGVLLLTPETCLLGPLSGRTQQKHTQDDIVIDVAVLGLCLWSTKGSLSEPQNSAAVGLAQTLSDETGSSYRGS